MGSTTDYEVSNTIKEITSSSNGSTDTTLTFFTPSTTRTTISTNRPTITEQRRTNTRQWQTAYSTWEYTTYPSPTYPESTPNSTLIIIIVLSFCVIFGLIYCVIVVFQNRRAKQQRSARNLNNAALMATISNNSNLRFSPPIIYPQGIASQFTSVTVSDQLPDYGAVMMEPTAPQTLPRPQLIIRSFTQENDSQPPNYVTPDANALPFALPLPPTYEEAISSSNC